jgi:Secretion system C-terminal sorting domain
MQRLNATLLFVLPVIYLTAQVPKKILVEHFTNTNCSICASKNPSFFSNLNKQTNTLYLSIHPSAPYASCLLSKQNKVDNDARTNYYDVYGATPIVVINGQEVLGSISTSNIFSPHLGATSPISVKIEQRKYGNDSIVAKVIIKNQLDHSLDNVSLFVALAEDTVKYKGTNGEPEHFNVMRKSLSQSIGDAIILSKKAGDSTVVTYRSAANAIWNFSRIFTVAALQDIKIKSIIQSEAVSPQVNNLPTSANEINEDLLPVVYPNPVNDLLSIKHFPSNQRQEAIIVNTLGHTCGFLNFNNQTFSADVSSLNPGYYYVMINTTKGVQGIQFIKI